MMTDGKPDCLELKMPGGKSRWMQRGVLGAVCLLVIGVYACTACSGFLESLSLNAADAYYNLLVQGFRSGQLNVKREVPPGLAQLADPYDPTANKPYVWINQHPLFDMSYYRGKLYLYWGVTPALILFWPFVALTDHYLFHRQAVAIFCAIGFLASVGLLHALWRRYFAEVSVWVVAACALALGLATGVPVLLPRSEIYEVPISCGYMLTMLALGALWCALHEPERRCRWLAVASAAYGLAVGARPSLLFGAVILLVPVAQAWRERRPIWAVLMAAISPIVLIGLGLMLYNALRFDSPFEFGLRYQLSGKRLVTWQFFSLHYLWFNFRVYFLELARWNTRFPFVHEIVVPPLPAGFGRVETPFGVLTNIPVVWLALAVPLAWRGRSGRAGSILRWFVMAVRLLFGICALTILLFCSANFRYEIDFLPTLVLLAVVGVLGLERALAPPSESGLAHRPLWRWAVRWGWCLLLGFSVAFNLLGSVDRYAEAHNYFGVALELSGRVPEAIEQYKQAVRIKPDFAEVYYNLGAALWEADKSEDAIGYYERALRLKPDFAEAHYSLGIALRQMGRVQEAIAHYGQALRIRPDYAEAHNNLGVALVQLGRIQEAIGHWEQALRIKPDYAEAHYNLGLELAQVGKIQEAIGHYEQALRIKPNYAEAHCSLGIALSRAGRVPEAIGHWEQALRIKPDYPDAHYNLGLALEQTGNVKGAIGHYEQALRIRPDAPAVQNNLAWLLATLAPVDGGDPVRAVTLAERACALTGNRVAPYLDTLAAAYAAAGRFNDAIAAAQKAAELARAAGQTKLVSGIEAHLELYRAGRPYRLLRTPVRSLPQNPLPGGSADATVPHNP